MAEQGQNGRKTYEYITDCMYFVIRPYEIGGPRTYLLCSGVNVSRFLPITRKRHGLASNPSLRGLELVNLDVRTLALSRGAVPKAYRGNDCAGITPTQEIWYSEGLLLEDASPSFVEEITPFCVISLLRKITRGSGLTEVEMPAALPTPEELSSFVDSLVSRHGTTG